VEKLKKILDFLSLMGDDKESLSLTNIALVVLTLKMALSPTLDWPAVVTIMTVFANYAHKRDTRKSDEAGQKELQETLKAQTSTIEEYKNKIMPFVDMIKGKPNA
jgi:hypothetical protein